MSARLENRNLLQFIALGFLSVTMVLNIGCCSNQDTASSDMNPSLARQAAGLLTFAPSFDERGDVAGGRYLEHNQLLKFARDLVQAEAARGGYQLKNCFVTISETGGLHTNSRGGPMPFAHATGNYIINASFDQPSPSCVITLIAFSKNDASKLVWCEWICTWNGTEWHNDYGGGPTPLADLLKPL